MSSREGDVRLALARRRRAQLLAEREQMSNCTFQPQINTGNYWTRRVEEQRQRARSVASRNGFGDSNGVFPGLDGDVAAAKRRASLLRATAEEAQQCSFNPEISRISRVLADNYEGHPNLSFAERQQLFEARKQQRLSAIEEEERQRTTFRPEVTRRASYREPLSVRYDRTMESARARIARLREQVAAEERSACSFHPNINPVSREICQRFGAQGTAERLESEAAALRAERERVTAEARRSEEAQCVFRPRITRNAEQMHSSYGPCADSAAMMQRIALAQRRREQYIQERQNEVLESERRECSFQPRVNSNPPPLQQAPPIPGLGRHLELAARAQQKQYEARERYEEVFFVPESEKRTDAVRRSQRAASAATRVHVGGGSYIKPQAFHLATESRISHRSQEPISDSCSYHPRTNAREDAEIVDALLEEF